MSAIDLAIAVGGAMMLGGLVFLVRRGRPRTRLSRLSPAAGPKPRMAVSPALPTPRGRPSGQRLRRIAGRAGTVLTERPIAALSAAGSLTAGGALLLAGPVAATAATLYLLVGLLEVRRRLIRQAADRAVTELLDAIDAAAGDLRAGIVPDGPSVGLGRGGAAISAARRRRREDVAVQVAVARLEAAQRISSALGMPLADLLDRVDADLRAGQALRVGIAAQTSAAQATTVLLLGLPLVGLWLGAALGVDPVGQLLHTPLGAACAVLAVALQCAGLLWTGRMVHAVSAEVR